MATPAWSKAQTAAQTLSAPEIVIKRGAEPTLVRAGGEAWVEVATERVERVVDTTAAGDSALAPATCRDGCVARAVPRLPPLATGSARAIQHPGAVIPPPCKTRWRPDARAALLLSLGLFAAAAFAQTAPAYEALGPTPATFVTPGWVQTTGGAGGRIVRVTTLASDGPGSLKAALDTLGPRTIV